MLYSAAGVALPSQQGAPPITTQRPTFSAKPGSRASASAILVSGPSVTSVKPGSAAACRISASTAYSASAARFGAGIVLVAEPVAAVEPMRVEMAARQRRGGAEIDGNLGARDLASIERVARRLLERTLPATVVSAATRTSGAASAIRIATASSEAVSVSMRNVRMHRGHPGSVAAVANAVSRSNPRARSVLQILDVLKPDLQSHRRAAGRPCGRGAVGRTVERNDQAFVAAPTVAEPKQLQRVEHRRDRRLGDGLQDDAEQAGGAEKVALPYFVAGVVRQRGMDDALDLRRASPANAPAPAPAARPPSAGAPSCADRAARESNPRDPAEWRRGRRRPSAAATIFRWRKSRPSSRSEWPDRYLVPASMARSTPRSCGGKKSGVAQVLSMMTQTPRAWATAAIAGMSCISSDCEPGASVRIARVLARISSAIAGADRRIVVGRLDAERTQYAFGETPRGEIGGVGHQQMIAALQRRLQRHGDRGEARGRHAPFRRRPRVRSRRSPARRSLACRACRKCSVVCRSSATPHRDRAPSSRETPAH